MSKIWYQKTLYSMIATVVGGASLQAALAITTPLNSTSSPSSPSSPSSTSSTTTTPTSQTTTTTTTLPSPSSSSTTPNTSSTTSSTTTPSTTSTTTTPANATGTTTSSTNTSTTNTNATNTQDHSQTTTWMLEAAQAAKDYLDSMDKGQYADAWTKGDALFQRTIGQKEWANTLQLAHKKLGAVKSRTLKDERPAMDPHGLPKGPYMVVEYNTTFEHIPQANEELLTLRLGPDGKWRVLTYQIKESEKVTR